MKIVVEGGQELTYGSRDSRVEVIKVETSYMLPENRQGSIHKLVPTRLSDIHKGDILAYKVSRDNLIVGRRNYMFVGQVPYRLKKVILVNDDPQKYKRIIDTETTTKYLTIDKFLFKGVRPVESVSRQCELYRDRDKRRSKTTRKVTNLRSTKIRRKRRSTKAI